MRDSRHTADLADFRAALEDADYNCEMTSVPTSSRVLLAENPYSLIAIVEMDVWDSVEQSVFDVQSELSRLVAESTDAEKRWDMYVLVHLRTPSPSAVDVRAVEALEADTRYARKFVRWNLENSREELDRALRPFLPLRAATAFESQDVLQLLHRALATEGIEADLAESAIESFRLRGEVRLG